MADICAGAFTASLKYESAQDGEKHKYQCGHELFFNCAYRKTRSSFYNPPYYDVYTHGVKEVPNGAGKAIAQTVARQIETNLERDLMREIYEARGE